MYHPEGATAVPERRALLIGVSGFAESADGSLSDLDFAARKVGDLSQVLRDGFGYSVTTMTEPGMTTVELGQTVRQAIVAAEEHDILLVHLLTHGVARENLLYALGSDGIIDGTAEVGGWLADLQYAPGRPLTLFTLDLCNSGIVTRLPWQTGHGRDGQRGWVIAACEPDRNAFDGLFTRALATVLRELAQKDFPVDPAGEFVPLKAVARAVSTAAVMLAKSAGGYQQYVVTSKLDMTADDPAPPFFRNPSHGEISPGRSGLAVDSSLLPLLDDPDFRHFIESASGSTVVSDLTGELSGCFSGREQELHSLSRWLERDDEGSLAVVTGSPGAGKSALLGLLVCAAHPALREPTERIWRVVRAVPQPAGVMCAVHAGQRGLAEVAAALGAQIGLGGQADPGSVRAALAGLTGQRPVVVVDSLDEATDAGDVASWLESLTSLTRPDGSAAVRLLVGTRAYPESRVLRELAQGPLSRHYDLDAVAAAVLEDDLLWYVTKLLRTVPGYRDAHPTVGAFAGTLAETLARNHGHGWGEFLVAGLFTRHFLGVFRPEDGPGAAGRLAATVPRTMPEILDLDLARHPEESWLEPVLRAVAHARGSGMPASVIRRVAAMLRPDTPQPSPADVAAALRVGRTYLRQSTDGEKFAAYRIFHDGLAQRLRRPEETEAVYHGILAGTGPASQRAWSAAEPYVLAHALDHAADTAELLDDPGFLVYADPQRYLPLLSDGARKLVCGVTPTEPVLARRAALARAAVESGKPDIAHRTDEMPGEPPLLWLPLWADGTSDGTIQPAAVVPAALDTWGNLRVWSGGAGTAAPDELPDSSAFALARQDSRLVIVTGNAQGAVRVDRAAAPLATHGAGVAALAIADCGGNLVVISGGENGTVLTHSLADGGEIRDPVTVPGSVRALAAGGPAPHPVVACVTAAGQLWTWRIGTAQNQAPYHWTLPSPVRSVAVTTLVGRPVVLVGCDDGTARSLDYQTHAALKVLGEHGASVQTVATEIVARRAVAVTGDFLGQVRKWDLLTGRRDGEPLKVCRGPVVALAVCATPGGLLCLAGGKGNTGGTALWELEGRTQRYELGRGGAERVAFSVSRSADRSEQSQRRPSMVGILASPDGRTLAIIGDHDGAVRAVEFDSGRPLKAAMEATGYAVTSIGIVSLGGIPAAVIGSDHLARLWQPFAGVGVVARAGDGMADALNPRWRNSIVIDGELLAVTRGRNGSLLVGADPITEVGDVTAVAVTHLDGRPVALVGDSVDRVRVLDLRSRSVSEELDVGSPVFAIAATADGRLAVGAGGCVYAFRRFSGPAGA